MLLAAGCWLLAAGCWHTLEAFSSCLHDDELLGYDVDMIVLVELLTQRRPHGDYFD